MINTTISVLNAVPNGNHPAGYIIGAVISLLILIYLIYSLINPEKF